MKRFSEYILYLIFRFFLSLRYRIKVKGKESLTPEALSKSGGTLFLANHPAEIDPCILLTTFWFPFKPHPVAIDYLFRIPFVRPVLDLIGALPVPNFDSSSNSYKRRQIEKTYQRIYETLDQKQNLLIYPAGGLKNDALEVIGGASGVQTILEARPNINIVLVRITGLWGSTFSRAPTGKTPNLFSAFGNGLKVLLRNFIFFAPRREVTVECCVAPQDFPWSSDRLTLNRYLENFFNAGGAEPLKLVSFSCFRKVYPAIKDRKEQEEISSDNVSDEVKTKVLKELVELTSVPSSEIKASSHLALDLGLDSLDISQLVVSLKEIFGLSALQSSDLTTVGSIYLYAARLKTSKSEEDIIEVSSLWEKEKNRPKAFYPDGETLLEVFFKTCERMNGFTACVDQISGEVSYSKLKLGVILLADAIRKFPGERIGIMMPASVAVNVVVLATLLAGKVPVMINWTLGGRNLRSVVEQSNIQVTLSSWSFIDRLENAELDGLDDQIVLLEEMRRNFSSFAKLKAYLRSRKKTRSLLKTFRVDKIKPDDSAVVLFTSGTESFPKGVPLSHKNILSNQRGAYKLVEAEGDDILLGALPPFHSFGFSVTGIFPLLAGLRTAFTPNPTDGKKMATAIEQWKISLICLAPTFLKNVLRVASEKQLKSVRLVVTGAEKTAEELFEKLSALNPQAILVEGYGITECAPILTLNPPDQPTQGVGHPLEDIHLKIVHPETLKPVELGKQGLILARGPNIFKGYLDPSLPSPFVECENHSWYQTGDLGYLDERGYLTLSGRLKRFIKIGGEMVSLLAIEESLVQSAAASGWQLDPEVPSLAVCAVEEEGKKSEIHLFTTFQTTADAVNQALRESGMSNLIKIRSVIKVPFIPLLGSGKIDYRRLNSKIEST